jgi:hypothetical protein
MSEQPLQLVSPSELQAVGYPHAYRLPMLLTEQDEFRSDNIERMTVYGPVMQFARRGIEQFFEDLMSPLTQSQQIPTEPGSYQRSVGKFGEDFAIWLRTSEQGSSRFDPYFDARSEATRATRYDIVYSFSTASSEGVWRRFAEHPQTVEETPAFAFPEAWNDQDDSRFDFLVEREVLGELDSNESYELEQLSNKRGRTLARVSEEDWAKEKERSKALTELEDLLKRYAPLFAKRT